MGIASRAPVPVRRLTLPRRDARVAEIALRSPDGGRVTVEVLNIHVEAPHTTPTWTTVARRRGQWRGLERHIKANPHRARLVVGDFNSTPLWPFYRRMAGHLHDAAVIHARRRGARAGRTWGPWHGSPRLCASTTPSCSISKSSTSKSSRCPTGTIRRSWWRSESRKR
jgi:endonuclease/exonuclease/phosphatase family metal-dependent hydrolase